MNVLVIVAVPRHGVELVSQTGENSKATSVARQEDGRELER